MINVHGLRRNVKNVVKNYSDAQIKVREATSNDPWGPSGTLMSEIADLTYNVVAFSEIMQVIWKRLNDHGKNWKHVYKALVLLEYLIKTGSEKVTQQCKENIISIQTLKDFQYFEESKDQGVNVREKAKQLVALLKDDERLRNERARALKARERFAQSNNYTKHETVARRYGSSEFSRSSYDDDMLSPGALSLSELEHARPQTAGEEELQLQLALAMSKEEADQAERLKRNDDLRLQMALSESEQEFKRKLSCELKPERSAIDDLLDLNLDQSLNGNSAEVPTVDPWGMAVSPQNNATNDEEWNSNSLMAERNQNLIQNDPWSPASVDTSDSEMMNSGIFSSSQGNTAEQNSFNENAMKKSVSAGVSNPSSLEAFLSSESSLVTFDANTRLRSHGNPFQAAKPTPISINELRASNSQSFQPSMTNSLPTSTSMPLQSNLHTNATYFSPSPNTSPSPQNNPFM